MIIDPTWPAEQRLKVADILVQVFEREYQENPFLEISFRLQGLREILIGSIELLESQRESAEFILEKADSVLGIR